MKTSISSKKYELLESLLWDGRSLFLDLAHIDRLQKAARFFDFPLDRIKIESELYQHCSYLPAFPYKIRLLVDKKGDVTCQSVKITPVTKPVICRLAQTPVDTNNPFLYHKTTQRSLYDQALSSVVAIHSDCQEVLLWNQRGELTEGSRSNIVVEREGKRLTPSFDCGLLAGTFRQHLLQQGKIEESIIRLDELPTFHHFWLINSVRKWQNAEVRF